MVSPGPGIKRSEEGTSWEELSERLLLKALLLKAKMVALYGRRGLIEPEDLVQGTIERYLASPTGLGYDPARAKLYTFLSGVMEKILLEEIGKGRFIVGSLDDPEFAKTVSPTTDPTPHYERQLLLQEIRQELEPDHLKLVEAIETTLEETDDKGRINQNLAERLGTTVMDAVNRKKRLRRRLERLS